MDAKETKNSKGKEVPKAVVKPAEPAPKTNKKEKGYRSPSESLTSLSDGSADSLPSNRSRSRGTKRKSSRSDPNPPKKARTAERDVKGLLEDYSAKLGFSTKFGKNIYCPSPKPKKGLRPIYIDGSNVAFSHGENKYFSVRGLKLCIDYFKKRGHEVKAFVPHFRLRKGESTDPELLQKLVNEKSVITTPTLYIKNEMRSPYDDWYIVQAAAANGGIIVSRDNFQDIIRTQPTLRTAIEECRLVPTFVDDMLIFPVDPHGNRRNNLEEFLKFQGASR